MAHRIPGTTNLAAASGLVALHLLAGLALPLAFAPHVGAWLLAPLVLVLTTVPHWALLHEAIHGHLHPNERVNEGMGRALAVLFGSPFLVLRFGHLSHHTLNGTPTERPELYDPGRMSRLRAFAGFYSRLFFGLYFAELVSGILCLLPKRLLAPVLRWAFYEGEADARGMPDRAERQLLLPDRLARIRLDGVLGLLWLGACAYAYGTMAWVLVLLILGRGMIVSFMDNAPHYGGEVADPAQGYDMAAPAPVAAFVLNTNLHGTHHRHPNLPWTELPGMFEAERRSYAGSYLVLPWRQLHGPLPVENAPDGEPVLAH